MEDLLRQPLEAIERLQSDRLQRMLALCARGHSFYRQRWSEAGIDVASIRTVRDLERLPLLNHRPL